MESEVQKGLLGRSKEQGKISQDGLSDISKDTKVAWLPGIGEQFPWIGLLGLFCVFLGTILATVILRVSDQKMIKQWPLPDYTVRPNVLINLANQLASVGLITAIMQGMAIAWWRKAVHGSTLSELHRSHSYSSSFFAVLTSGKHFNKIALAALMAKFPVIDSTLFQQATRTGLYYKPTYSSTTIDAWISTTWPQGIGGIPGSGGQVSTVDTDFARVIEAFNSKVGTDRVHDTETLFVGCPAGQLCTGKIDAFGFSFDCSTDVQDINYSTSRDNSTASLSNTNTSITYPLWSVSFVPDWATESKPYASINMTMLYVNTTEGPDHSCPGTLTKRTCSIKPAVVSYPISILAGDSRQSVNVTHLEFHNFSTKSYAFSAPMTDSQIDGIHVINETKLNEKYGNVSTVAAITFALNNLFKSSANVTWGKDWSLSVSGARAQSEFTANSTSHLIQHCDYALDRTSRGVADPFIYMLRQVNTFAFVSALYLSGVSQIKYKERARSNFFPKKFNTTVSGYVEIYKTNYRFVAAAIATSFLTLLGVLPVYWGFWQLGRKVSLGPIEIANAFDAPIFGRPDAKNGDIDELLDEVGKTPVIYGWLVGDSADPKGQLGFAEPHRVVSVEKAIPR